MRTQTIRSIAGIALACGLALPSVCADEHQVPDSDAPAALERVQENWSAKSAEIAASVRVETPLRLIPPTLMPKRVNEHTPGSRQIVYINEAGELVAPPPGALPTVRRALAPQPVRTFSGTSPGGGICVDTSHIRSYSYATIGPDGTLQIDCDVSGSIEEAQSKAKAAATHRNAPAPINDTESD